MTRIRNPLFVMAFVAGLIFAAALLLSTIINSAETPFENAPTVALNKSPAAAAEVQRDQGTATTPQ